VKQLKAGVSHYLVLLTCLALFGVLVSQVMEQATTARYNEGVRAASRPGDHWRKELTEDPAPAATQPSTQPAK
jgi:hypothetical protein